MNRLLTGIVIDLFSNRASDRRHANRIDSIVAAVIKNGRLYLELGLDGALPPPRWLSSLTCSVKLGRGIEFSAKIECVARRDGDQFLVRTFPLSDGSEDGYLPAGTTVDIRSASGPVCSKTFYGRSDKPLF